MECLNQPDSNPYLNYYYNNNNFSKISKVITIVIITTIFFLFKLTENIGFEPMMGITHN